VGDLREPYNFIGVYTKAYKVISGNHLNLQSIVGGMQYA
jgi:hypothetical protein